MQFEYDPEQLIAEVCKRPGIWNYDDPQYRVKHLKSKLWHEVVNELVSLNEATMSKSQMRELELQLQKKWKSLRDCFAKFLNNPNKFKRAYVYSKQLQFLLKDKQLPTQRRKQKTRSESSESNEDTTPRNVWVTKKKIRISKTEEVSDDNDNSYNDNNTEDYTIEAINTTEPETRNAPSEGHFAFANVEVPAKSDTDDSDKMFLMSLLPHLRSIPEDFRLNVKLELMQVLRAANESTAKLKYPYSNLD